MNIFGMPVENDSSRLERWLVSIARRIGYVDDAAVTDEERDELLVAHQVLKKYQIKGLQDGFTLDALAREVYAEGWRYDINRVPAGFHAVIFPERSVTHRTMAVGYAATAEAAMAIALATALERRTNDHDPGANGR